MRVCIHVDALKQTNVHICTYACIHTHTYIYMYRSLCVCVYVYVYISKSVVHFHICILFFIRAHRTHARVCLSTYLSLSRCRREDWIHGSLGSRLCALLPCFASGTRGAGLGSQGMSYPCRYTTWSKLLRRRTSRTSTSSVWARSWRFVVGHPKP